MVTHFSLFAGTSYGQRSLVGCAVHGAAELDTTEQMHAHKHTHTNTDTHIDIDTHT